MEKRNIIITFISIILVVVVFVIISNWKIENKEKLAKNETENEIEDKYDPNVINEIKNEINATASTDMYQIEEEYDGRKILQIKPSIQYQTVLAGILKSGQPSENEIEDLLANKPTKTGIWIAKSSREKFLELLKNNNMNEYQINQEGYLEKSKENSQTPEAQKINTAIASERLYVIDVSGTSYTRDEFSGEIVEYPFEKMDPYQIIDVYRDEKNVILEVTTDEKQKFSAQEILSEIIRNFE